MGRRWIITQIMGWVLGLSMALSPMLWSGESDEAHTQSFQAATIGCADDDPVDELTDPDSYLAVQISQPVTPVRALPGFISPLVLPTQANFTACKPWLLQWAHCPRTAYSYIAGMRFIFEYQIAINAP
jgi:hypothetical protein